MRQVALSAVKAGITRLREKGGATPDSLFDLVNGHVTAARTIVMRPGSEVDHVLPEGETKGLVLFQGLFVVFADHFVDLDSSEYALEILTHPDSNSEATLEDVRVSAPFLGYLYVVARWSDGRIVHYWLQSAPAWTPNTTYSPFQLVSPSSPNGWAYEANRLGEPGPAWAPNIERAEADVVEPTVANGFEYVAIEAYGLPPRSGTVEPVWPTEEGAVVIEEADIVPPTTTTPPQTPRVPPDVGGRYGSGRDNDDYNNWMLQ